MAKILQNITSIKIHKDTITYLNIISDGRLVSCSKDFTIKILKQNTFELQLTIKEHKFYVNSITELNDKRLISCSFDTTMKIIKFVGENNYKIEQTLIGHLSNVLKVIEIKENELISISWDQTMKIWKINKKKEFLCFKTLKIQNTISYCNIIKLNNKQFCTSVCDENCLKFWNSENYSNNNIIYNIEITWNLNSMCLLNDDLLCIGGINSNGFYLIQVSTQTIIKKIVGPKNIISLFKCEINTILCVVEDEFKNNNIFKFRFKNGNFEKIFEKEKTHDKIVYSCIEFKNGIIVSGAEDNLIKLWTQI